jgi:uncharacterized protein YjbI with pentapeptide repeats
MKKQDTERRWQNPEFLASMMPILSAVFDVGRFTGPADLRGLVVGLDGTPSFLNFKGLIRANLTDIDFSFSKMAVKFTEGTFHRLDFTQAKLDRSVMSKASWNESTFDYANICIEADDAVFVGCSFRKTTFRGVSWQYGGRRTRFVKCDFGGASFIKTKFLACHFEECILDDVDFGESDFRGAQIDGQKIEIGSNQGSEATSLSLEPQP